MRVVRDRRGGSSLYDELELLIEQQGIVHFLACIALLNDASISFHKKRGYQQVDHFPKIGYKFGQWHDNNVVTEEFGQTRKIN